MIVIDTHTHFGDPSVPKQIYRTELPPVYRGLHGAETVTGTVVTESTRRQGRVETAEECAASGNADNEWTLQLADKDPFVVGVVGDLDPYSEQFEGDLAHFAADLRFVGYRLTTYSPDAEHPDPDDRHYTGHPSFTPEGITPRLLQSLRATAAAGLVLDVHGAFNPSLGASCAEPFLTAVIQQVPGV